MTNQEHAWFVQDDLRVNSRLTLNLGLRYEIYQPDVEIRNRLVNFDLSKLKLVYAGEDGTSDTANKETRYGNLGPRIGFAWDMFGNSKMVLRGGYGISYFPDPQSASNLIGQQVPYDLAELLLKPTPSISAVPTIANPFRQSIP
jgi:outer membrane receptor protein involved in Fe transport